MINVAAESTRLARLYARAAEEGGAAALMAIPPISRGLSEDELRAYFTAMLRGRYSNFCAGCQFIRWQSHEHHISSQPLCRIRSARIIQTGSLSAWSLYLRTARSNTGAGGHLEGSGGGLLIDSFRRGITGTIPGVELLDGTTAL